MLTNMSTSLVNMLYNMQLMKLIGSNGVVAYGIIMYISFFTALNNGVISAIISFLITLLFQIGTILLLPLIIGVDGIWEAVIIAELLALGVSIICIIKNKQKYQYIQGGEKFGINNKKLGLGTMRLPMLENGE